MIKFIPQDTDVVFSEIPEETTLAINISNCQNRCIGCHSPYLRENVGEVFDEKAADDLLKKNNGVTCICLMGEGNDKEALFKIISYIKEHYKWLKTAIYSGRNNVEDDYDKLFDYIKIGPYIEKYGPLNKKTTNQRFYNIIEGKRVDITYKFWRTKI